MGCDASDTAWWLKQRISATTDIPVREQRLFAGSTEMRNAERLGDILASMRATVAKRVMVPAKGRSMAHQRHQEVVEVAAAVVLQEHRDIFKCRTATDSNAHFRNRLMMSNALDFQSCEAGVRRRWPAPPVR